MQVNSILLLLFLLLCSDLFGQVPEKNRGQLGAIRQVFKSSKEPTETMKCGTPMFAQMSIQWQILSPQVQFELKQLTQRPVRQKDKLSPSGKFRIHYDTTGIHTPALISASNQRLPNTYEAYVDSVAKIFEFVFDVEINQLGYERPPSDGMEGGGPEYDVYIENLDQQTFGYTAWEPMAATGGNERYPTYIVIDNDYLGYRTSGFNGLKVTAAHEFHHAIQIGAYGIWTNIPNRDFYFYEITANWMEDVVFTNINDYYYDLPLYFRGFRDFQNRSYSFTFYDTYQFAGYERSVWAHFLSKRFGIDVMKMIWNGMKTAPFLKSIARVLSDRGSDLATEFATFAYWNFFTADRADTVRFYPEGKNYPRFLPNATATYNGFSSSISTAGYPLSSQFFEFRLGSDTLTAVVANINLNAAMQYSGSVQPLGIQLSSNLPGVPYQNLSNGLKAGFSTDVLSSWNTLYLFSSTKNDAKLAADASPNPLRLSVAPVLTLPVRGSNNSDAEVFFVSSSFDLRFSSRYPIADVLGNRYVYVPTKDLQSSVSSGIYFVVVHCTDAEFRWKVAVIQ